MRRFFTWLLLGTGLALGYVQQRVWLITLGYEVEAVGSVRDDLLDQHRVLNYNVLTLRSPVILDERLSKGHVQLAPPTAVEVLTPPSLGTMTLSSAWDGAAAKGEPSWFDKALTFATNWMQDGRQAVAEPAKEER